MLANTRAHIFEDASQVAQEVERVRKGGTRRLLFSFERREREVATQLRSELWRTFVALECWFDDRNIDGLLDFAETLDQGPTKQVLDAFLDVLRAP